MLHWRAHWTRFPDPALLLQVLCRWLMVMNPSIFFCWGGWGGCCTSPQMLLLSWQLAASIDTSSSINTIKAHQNSAIERKWTLNLLVHPAVVLAHCFHFSIGGGLGLWHQPPFGGGINGRFR